MNTNSFCIAATVGAGSMLLLTAPAFAAPGDLDPGFGIGGRVIVDTPGYWEEANSIAQQGDKLLVGRAVVNWPIGEHFSVIRLSSDGSLDTTFDRDGKTSANLPGSVRGITYAALPLANGKIIAAGYVSNQDGLDVRYGLVRYLHDGTLDSSFGSAGSVVAALSQTHGWIRAAVEQPDGRLVVAGGVYDGETWSDIWLARINTDGSFDTSFGSAGIFRLDFFGMHTRDAAQSLELQEDGSIVVAGYAQDAEGVRHLAMLRVRSDGSLDRSFGNDGVISIPAPGVSAASKVGLQRQADGKLVIAGQTRDDVLGDCEVIVARFDSSGTPDPTFNGNGVARWSLGSCWTEASVSLAIEPGGAVSVGYVGPALQDAVVQRLTPGGALDSSFGVNGTALVDVGRYWGSNASHETGVHLVRQADGKIALTASDTFDWWEGGAFFLVARLLDSGASAGLIGFADSYAQGSETSGSAEFIVRRTGGASGEVTVDFTTTNGDVFGAANFVASQGTLTWADGDSSSRTITITIVDDSIWEGSESVNVSLSKPTGGASLAMDRAYLHIEENEPAPPSPQVPPTSGQAGNGEIRRGGALGLETLLALGLTLALARRRRPERRGAR